MSTTTGLYVKIVTSSFSRLRLCFSISRTKTCLSLKSQKIWKTMLLPKRKSRMQLKKCHQITIATRVKTFTNLSTALKAPWSQFPPLTLLPQMSKTIWPRLKASQLLLKTETPMSHLLTSKSRRLSAEVVLERSSWCRRKTLAKFTPWSRFVRM